MASKQQVMDLHAANPDWSARDIARHLGCMPEYVHKTAARYNLTLPHVHKGRNDPKVLRQKAKALMMTAQRLLNRADAIEKEGSGAAETA